MSIISKVRQQTATLWKKRDLPNLMGEDVYFSPVTIECRWTDEYDHSLGETGETIVTSHKVFVDRELQIGDLLCKGDASPFSVGESVQRGFTVKEVKRKRTIPNLRNTETLYILFL